MEMSEDCVICKQPIDETSPTATLGARGTAGINKASEARNDTIQCTPGQKVHQECRRKYCNPDTLGKHGHSIATGTGGRVLRSTEKRFDFSTDCFFCGKTATFGRKRKSSDVVPVKTLEVRDTILAVCHERGDAWADAVLARILHVHDLHAADAVYHRVCSVNFRTNKQIPAVHENISKKVKLGRPLEKERLDAFLEVANFLEENDDEQITINDLTLQQKYGYIKLLDFMYMQQFLGRSL